MLCPEVLEPFFVSGCDDQPGHSTVISVTTVGRLPFTCCFQQNSASPHWLIFSKNFLTCIFQRTLRSQDSSVHTSISTTTAQYRDVEHVKKATYLVTSHKGKKAGKLLGTEVTKVRT